MKSCLLLMIISLCSYTIIAQKIAPKDLLKMVEVNNPLVKIEKKFEDSEINKWGSADPKETAMVISHYSSKGDSLRLDNEREITRPKNDSNSNQWQFIQKKSFSNSTYELEYHLVTNEDQKTFFVMKNDRLTAKYTETDSISYHYKNDRISRVDMFEKDARRTDGSVKYEDELEENGEVIIIKEAMIEDIEDAVEEIVIEKVEEDILETTISLGSDEKDYPEILEVVPAPKMSPTETLIYTYNKNGLMISVRRLMNRSYRPLSQVSELDDQKVEFTYNSFDLLETSREEKRVLKTMKGLPSNQSLIYWSEHMEVESNQKLKSSSNSNFEMDFFYNNAQQLESFTLKQTSNGEETNNGVVDISHNSNGISRIIVDEDIKQEVKFFEYDSNGYMIKETEQRYRRGDLLSENVKIRRFVYE